MWGFPKDWPRCRPARSWRRSCLRSTGTGFRVMTGWSLVQAWNRQIAHDQAELYASMVAVDEAEHEELSGISKPTRSTTWPPPRSGLRSPSPDGPPTTTLVWPRNWSRTTPSVGGPPTGSDRPGQGQGDHQRNLSSRTEHRKRVAEAALERAPQQTTGQLGARIRKLVILSRPRRGKDPI